MVHIITDQYAPYGERLSLRLIAPRRLLTMPLIVMVACGIVIIAVGVLMHNASLPPNLFTEFADVMPGQAAPALDTRGFNCPHQDYNYYHDPAQTWCDLAPTSGAFSRIEVVYSSGLIHQTSFDLRDGALKLGELAAMLGISELHAGDSVVFTWRGNIGVARISHTKSNTLFRSIWQVTLTDTPMFRP